VGPWGLSFVAFGVIFSPPSYVHYSSHCRRFGLHPHPFAPSPITHCQFLHTLPFLHLFRFYHTISSQHSIRNETAIHCLLYRRGCFLAVERFITHGWEIWSPFATSHFERASHANACGLAISDNAKDEFHYAAYDCCVLYKIDTFLVVQTYAYRTIQVDALQLRSSSTELS
jgi:hypothetical protein